MIYKLLHIAEALGTFRNLIVYLLSYRIQQKRHGRVKTWTRHVDIFEKDFIFVPLNEA